MFACLAVNVFKTMLSETMNGWVKISIDTCVLVWPGLDRATWRSAVQFAVAGPRVLFIVFRSRWYTIVYTMTSSNGNIFRVTGPLCGEFTGPGEFPTQRPVTWTSDVFFDLRLNKRLSRQPWCWWFETPSWSLSRRCNAFFFCYRWT